MLPSVALAHGFVGDAGPGAGFMHPLTGPDHLLAMFAVGVLSAQLGGRAIWAVPGAFVTVMLVGGLVGLTQTVIPGTEYGVAISVIVLGAAVAFGHRTHLRLALLTAGVFGFFHGFAHGHEIPRLVSPWLYVLGFLVSTAGLHVLGALTALLVLCRPRAQARLQLGGASIGAAGVFFLLTAVAIALHGNHR